MTTSPMARRQRAMHDLSDSVRALHAYADRECPQEGGSAVLSDAEGVPPHPAPQPPEGIEVRPANAYEAVTRQMVEMLQEDLREIKGRLNTLLVTLLGGVALDVIARWVSR